MGRRPTPKEVRGLRFRRAEVTALTTWLVSSASLRFTIRLSMTNGSTKAAVKRSAALLFWLLSVSRRRRQTAGAFPQSQFLPARTKTALLLRTKRPRQLSSLFSECDLRKSR